MTRNNISSIGSFKNMKTSHSHMFPFQTFTTQRYDFYRAHDSSIPNEFSLNNFIRNAGTFEIITLDINIAKGRIGQKLPSITTPLSISCATSCSSLRKTTTALLILDAEDIFSQLTCSPPANSTLSTITLFWHTSNAMVEWKRRRTLTWEWRHSHTRRLTWKQQNKKSN